MVKKILYKLGLYLITKCKQENESLKWIILNSKRLDKKTNLYKEERQYYDVNLINGMLGIHPGTNEVIGKDKKGNDVIIRHASTIVGVAADVKFPIQKPTSNILW